MIGEAVLPPRDEAGRTLWVTRARPKVDRIACPWLIRRFVDPAAIFLFVAPAEVAGVARALRRRAVRRRGRVLEPPRRTLHLRRDGRGARPRPASRRSRGSRSSSAAPTPRAPSSRRRRPGCSPPRSACRACMPTISPSSRRACRSTTPSTAGAATRSTRPTTGFRTRPSRGSGHDRSLLAGAGDVAALIAPDAAADWLEAAETGFRAPPKGARRRRRRWRSTAGAAPSTPRARAWRSAARYVALKLNGNFPGQSGTARPADHPGRDPAVRRRDRRAARDHRFDRGHAAAHRGGDRARRALPRPARLGDDPGLRLRRAGRGPARGAARPCCRSRRGFAWDRDRGQGARRSPTAPRGSRPSPISAAARGQRRDRHLHDRHARPFSARHGRGRARSSPRSAPTARTRARSRRR